MTFDHTRMEAYDATATPIVMSLARAATQVFQLPPGRIWAPDQKPYVARARFAVFTAGSETGVSASSMGRIFGMNHSSILYGLKAAEIYSEKIDGYADKLNALRAVAEAHQ